MEIKTKYTAPTVAHFVPCGDSHRDNMVLIPAQAGFWTAVAYDDVGNHICTAKGNTEAEACANVEATSASMEMEGDE